MKRDNLRGMFNAAVLHRISTQPVWTVFAPEWLDTFSPSFGGEVAYPSGTNFLHGPAVARADSSDINARVLFSECAPDTVLYRNLNYFYFYEDGYDVLAGTGALVAIRSKKESGVLQQ